MNPGQEEEHKHNPYTNKKSRMRGKTLEESFLVSEKSKLKSFPLHPFQLTKLHW